MAKVGTPRGDKKSAKGKRILAAATDLVVKEGLASFSLRRVAQEMGTSLATLQYYYPSVDELLGATLVDIMNRVNDEVRVLAQQPLPVMERLTAVCDFVVAVNARPQTSRLVFEALSLAQRSEVAQRIVAASYDDYRDILHGLIAEAMPGIAPSECFIRATLVASMLEGLIIFAGASGTKPLAWSAAMPVIRDMVLAATRG